MTDLTQRVEALERRALPKPDPEWWRFTKLGLLWMNLGVLAGAILEHTLYGVARLAIPPYWWERPALIAPYVRFQYGIPALALVMTMFLCRDYLYRRQINRRHRTWISTLLHWVGYGVMLAAGFVGFMWGAQWVESKVWQTFKGVI
ncbi:MAG: hypothetical protein OEU26_00625 [Candidatus Tectomicrobia bacterium]|nr:hypothetical protein [Candidatus Tectomicrobia bacterium]